MRIFQKLALVATIFLTVQAQAFTPESGIWWNPNESGSGYAIEIQDNFLFVALYVYDVDGNPTWYTAGTTLQGNALFNSDLNYTYNGPCIDCNYTTPITIAGQRGPITINFITETTATIQFEGAVKNIERFNFLLGDETDRMLGEWQAIIDFSSTGAANPYIADVLLFDLITTSNGKLAEGCRPDNTIDGFCTDFALDNHYITAEYDNINNQLLIRVDDGLLDGVEYVFDYYLDIGLDHFTGVVEFHPKSSHNNIFYPVRGFRTASRSFVETGVGPSKSASFNKSKNISIGSNLGLNLPTKSFSDFSEEEKTRLLYQREIFDKMETYARKR